MAAPTALPIYGNPEACQRFNERHPRWNEMMVNLVNALNIAFNRKEPMPTMADKFVFHFGRRVYEDFMTITLLCQHGNGVGAAKLVRSMYEETVTLAYLHTHPEEAEAFFDYHAIQQDKLATRHIAALGPESIPPELLKQIRERAAEVKQDFMVPVCDHPNPKMRLNHSWNSLDFVSMAERTEAGGLLLSAYFYPLLHAHPTLGGLMQTLQNIDGLITVNPEAEYTIAQSSLVAAHNCLLECINVQNQHFHVEGLEWELELCKEDFLRIWAPLPNGSRTT